MNARRWRRLGMFVAVAVAALLGGALVGSPASAQAAKKYYTATISPTSVPAGTQSTVSFTLTNITANQYFGSANITFALPYSGTPSAGTVACSTNVPSCGNFSATVSTSATQFVVQLRSTSSSSGVPNSGSVTIPVSFTPTTDGTYTLGSAVKQSNDFSGTGNDFLLSGAAPQLTVSGVVCTTSPCTDSGVHTSATVTFSPNGALYMDIAPNSDACVSETRPEYVVVQMLSGSGGAKTVDIGWDKATTNAYTDNGVPHWEVCMSAPYTFTLDGGSQGTTGPLPLCGSPAVPPCISKLYKVAAAQHATVLLPDNGQDPKFF